MSEARPLRKTMYRWKKASQETRTFQVQFDILSSYTGTVPISAMKVPTAVLAGQHRIFAKPELWCTTIEQSSNAFQMLRGTLIIRVIDVDMPWGVRTSHIGDLY
jgi:hypothetical protein